VADDQAAVLMEEIGQLGLGGMPARARRVVLSAGPRAWWGVDASSRGVAIGWRAPGGAHGVVEAPFMSPVTPQTLARSFLDVRALASDLARVEERQPGFVMVEKAAAPGGRGPNYELLYALGVVQAGLHAGIVLGTASPPAWDLQLIASSWKKGVLGNGGIRKPKPKDVRAGATYAVHDWAVLNGFEVGSSWDKADACAIAAFAELTVEIRVR
jgi:hypothetical protein